MSNRQHQSKKTLHGLSLEAKTVEVEPKVGLLTPTMSLASSSTFSPASERSLVDLSPRKAAAAVVVDVGAMSLC